MITIVDYGMGNLKSVVKAFEHIGAEVAVTSDAETAYRAKALVVPGQGAFDDCMEALTSKNLDSAIKDHIFEGKPYLGICIGHQILFETHEESKKNTPGLGIYHGTVRKFPSDLKVPHMGWNQVEFSTDQCPLFKDIKDGESFYFVHSYYTEPVEKRIVAAQTDYGFHFASVLWDGAFMFSVQFHPEKSQNSGLKLLKNFYGLSQNKDLE